MSSDSPEESVQKYDLIGVYHCEEIFSFFDDSYVLIENFLE
jgi:hypothetical protein